ncbi:MAG: helix-turn-helix domain-containing protein [Proteobacteria bacterium]|nr:helix-turn-helix domain-containing protein [Pseudomonadota bacterium]MBU1695526.1 helix-turn-helix domain-containing protein [Pseudomonadota bacterium]
MSIINVCTILGISRPTLYRHLKFRGDNK